MMDSNKSKFKGNTFYFGALVSVGFYYGIFIMYDAIKYFPKVISSIENVLFTLLFVMLFFISTNYLSNIKYIIIKKETLKYYSIIRPFGKTLYFNNYIGFLKSTESGSAGSYKVIYLVDKQNMTKFKITGLFYKNMEEMIGTFPFLEIKRNLSPKQYFKLMFTGRANISKLDSKKNSEGSINKFLKILALIGFLFFIISMIIKLFFK